MNIKILSIFLLASAGFQIAAMQQPDLRQQLIHAAREGDLERVEKLMFAGAPVAPEALFYSTVNGNYDVVKTIFECGADPESPADPNQKFLGTPLFTHLVLNQTLQPKVKEDLILLYLKHGADLEVRGPTGFSMLIHGVHNLDFNTLKLLLEQGACANAQDDTGFTALMILALSPIHVSSIKIESEKMREQELIIKAELLIRYGADVNQKDNMGQTCLMKAIWIENKTFVELLIRNGADINLKDKEGETGLMKAVRNGNRSIVEFLLRNDANVDLENRSGLSALDYAKDQPEIMKLLEDAQKNTSKKSQDSESGPTKKIINNREI